MNRLAIELPQSLAAHAPGQRGHVVDVGVFDHGGQGVFGVAGDELVLHVLFPELSQSLLLSAGTAWQVPDQEFQRAQVRQFGGRGVIVRAALAGEGVALLGVEMQCHLRMTTERSPDARLRLRRAELVLAGDVEHERGLDAGGFAQGFLNPYPVVAHAAIRVVVGGQQVSEPAAETQAHAARRSRTGGMGAQGGQAGGQVFHGLSLVESLEELEGALPFRVGAVAELDARLLAPEQVGAKHGEASGGEPIGNLPHGLVDAEDLLNQHDPGADSTRRQG